MFKKQSLQEELLRDFDVNYHFKKLLSALGGKGYYLERIQVRKMQETGIIEEVKND